MDDTTIRQANQADASVIGALHVASWRETYTGLISEAILVGLSTDARTTMWRDTLGSPDESGCVAVFIAEDGGRAVGFGCCGRQRDDALMRSGFSGEFSAIYVLRSHQGRRIGRSIMAAMAQALAAAGHDAACLWVLRENGRARLFYDGMGGVVVGEKADQQSDTTLVEIAYGWRDLASLVR